MRPTGRTLVACFSVGGTTRAVAEEIVERAGADLFEIIPAEPYPSDLEAAMQRAEAESAEHARPAIAGELPDLSAYDNVFLGSPVWSMSPPRIMLTFVESVDLAGKRIVPFVTSGSTGLAGITEAYRRALPDARVADGLAVTSGEASDCGAKVAGWLQANQPVG